MELNNAAVDTVSFKLIVHVPRLEIHLGFQEQV